MILYSHLYSSLLFWKPRLVKSLIPKSRGHWSFCSEYHFSKSKIMKKRIFTAVISIQNVALYASTYYLPKGVTIHLQMKE